MLRVVLPSALCTLSLLAVAEAGLHWSTTFTHWGPPGTSSPVALAAAFSHNTAIDHLL